MNIFYFYQKFVPKKPRLAIVMSIRTFRLIPESPRLLLTKGKVGRAEPIVRKIKEINGDRVEPALLNRQLNEISREMSTDSKAGIMTIFASARMAGITCLFCITW